MDSSLTIIELARRLDRTTRTIKKWEKEGLIPKAQRDTRGWRRYTPQELVEIEKLVKENNYFLNRDN